MDQIFCYDFSKFVKKSRNNHPWKKVNKSLYYLEQNRKKKLKMEMKSDLFVKQNVEKTPSLDEKNCIRTIFNNYRYLDEKKKSLFWPSINVEHESTNMYKQIYLR